MPSQGHRTKVVQWPCDGREVTYVFTLARVARKSYGGRKVTARPSFDPISRSSYGIRKVVEWCVKSRSAAVQSPCGCRTISSHPGQQKRGSPHGHRKATVRPSYGGLAMLRNCGGSLAHSLRPQYPLAVIPWNSISWIVRMPCGYRNICDHNCHNPQVCTNVEDHIYIPQNRTAVAWYVTEA